MKKTRGRKPVPKDKALTAYSMIHMTEAQKQKLRYAVADEQAKFPGINITESFVVRKLLFGEGGPLA